MTLPLCAYTYVYIEDPTAILRGSRTAVRRMKAKLILIWRALKLDLAFRKGQEGSRIVWICHRVSCDVSAKTVSAQIKPEFLEELGKETKTMLTKNTMP